jgi:hypothetical protein
MGCCDFAWFVRTPWWYNRSARFSRLKGTVGCRLCRCSKLGVLPPTCKSWRTCLLYDTLSQEMLVFQFQLHIFSERQVRLISYGKKAIWACRPSRFSHWYALIIYLYIMDLVSCPLVPSNTHYIFCVFLNINYVYIYIIYVCVGTWCTWSECTWYECCSTYKAKPTLIISFCLYMRPL